MSGPGGNRISRILRTGEGGKVAEIGKMMLGLGVLLILVGAGLMLASRLGLPLGRLPGDMAYRGKHVSFFFPLGTSILISVVLSLVFYLLSRIQK